MDKCDLHSEQIDRILSDLQRLREGQHKINNHLQVAQSVVIRNGGGREVVYLKKDFEQMLYDTGKTSVRKSEVKDMIKEELNNLPSKAFDTVSSFSDRAYKILIVLGQLFIIAKLLGGF